MFEVISVLFGSTGAYLWDLLTTPTAKYLIDLFGALLTPVIGLATVYIAWQQRQLNKIRLSAELYDRRLKVYKALDEFYGEAGTLGNVTFAMALVMRTATAEAAFLFGAEIEKHLEDIYKKSVRIATLHEQMYPSAKEPGLPIGPERSNAAHEHGDLLLWLLQESKKESKKRFGNYLKLS